MQAVRSSGREAAEDLFFGQVVMNWARYFVIAGAMIMMLLTADDELMLVTGIVPIMGLLAVNFFLHGRYLVERPANRNLVVAAGVMDVAAIASVVLLWSAFRGFESPMFVLFYPVLVAYAFVLPPRVSAACAGLVLAAYLGTCLVTDPQFLMADSGAADVGAVKSLLARLITMGSMAGLGAYYWRTQRNRRRAVASEAGIVPATGV